MLNDGLDNRGSELGNGLGLDGLDNGLTLDGAHKLGRLWGGRAAGADVTLSLGAVLANILLHQAGGVRGTLASHIPKLVGLGVDDLLGVGNLLVNELAVADVDKGGKVCGGHGNHSQAPEGNEADQPVAGESSSESLTIY